ncbi:MAG: DNA-directed RNA polymerase subunit K [Methanobacteriota archaeon]|nr:MAG: DNA-directed RNA polymerase subunit K [Euryarchaeota archaeon]
MELKEIVSDKIEIGTEYLSKYERARIVGARALQISHGAPTLLEFENMSISPIEMARQELAARVLPIGVMRTLKNGKMQIVPIQWLKDGQYIGQIDPESEFKKFKNSRQ